MRLEDAIVAAGMTPPHKIVEGRWLRFPGMGKKSSNRSGWCRVISPTMAIFGDWSTGLIETWRDDTHRDDEQSKRLLDDARRRERQFAAEQRARQAVAADEAASFVSEAAISVHPYLIRKGFPDRAMLVRQGKLVIPVRDVADYRQIISAQLIDETGDKKFLTGGRTRGGIHRLGAARASRIVLCEGFATGLTLDAALSRLSGTHAVIVCFSAHNLERVATRFPGALVCADNDESHTGEDAAERTGLKWIMPPMVGDDWNDVMQRDGIYSVVAALRKAFTV